VGVNTGATWQIPLKRPSAAAMRFVVKLLLPLVRAALRSRCGHYILQLWFLLLLCFFILVCSCGRRLDVCHTSTHDVALVRI